MLQQPRGVDSRLGPLRSWNTTMDLRFLGLAYWKTPLNHNGLYMSGIGVKYHLLIRKASCSDIYIYIKVDGLSFARSTHHSQLKLQPWDQKQHFSNSFLEVSFHVISVVLWAVDFNQQTKNGNPTSVSQPSSYPHLQTHLGVPWCEGYAMSLYEVNLDASVKRILRLSNSTSLSTIRVPWFMAGQPTPPNVPPQK